MTTRTLVGGLIVLAFIIFGITLYYSFTNTDEGETVPQEEVNEGFVPDVINARHQVKGGVHTIVGEIDMPTPCDLLETDAAVEVREPNPDLATVQFSVVNESEVCSQVITPARFKVSFTAGDDAEIVGTWNGAPVRLNLIQVGPNENIDNFEVYIKG